MTEKPKLRLFDLTMIVVGLVIGMGIFRTASDAASKAITPSLFFLGWVAGGLVALCGALTYAEIGSRFPVTGGYYKVFAECYHPSIAFSINCIILISNAASMSGVALVGSEYISQVVFQTDPGATTRALIAMIPIAVFYGVNLLGLRLSATAQNILMVIKIGMLVLLISSIFFIDGSANQNLSVAKTFSTTDYVKSFGLILIAVSFTYGGYQQTINFGDEVQAPRKTIPKGIFIGIVIIISLYLAVSYAYYNAIGFDALKTSRGIASIVVEKLFGPTGRTAASVLLFVAVLAYVNVLLLSNPRVMFAMSKDGILPAAFSKKKRRAGRANGGADGVCGHRHFGAVLYGRIQQDFELHHFSRFHRHGYIGRHHFYFAQAHKTLGRYRHLQDETVSADAAAFYCGLYFCGHCHCF